ncbi:hypothetical protein [Winogradskya humida]|uniref:ABC-2 type transport system permease protein n=1 Tax=Winogradskya humida TaxID=113566 RepID=A0ABQ3ZKV0_9ACTN|nr:hypothetical protein [Actinoplanes humidus]GIE19183.1 hypothetical protein Ahu01nite_022850 [Actinoplanes humidus]
MTIALARMRLVALVRGGRILAPLIAGLVVLGIIHGGGQSPAASAYGYSAAMLFPVFAWLTKVVLDAEPDVQRRLARVAVGAARESAAGALAAVAAGLAFTVVAIAVPLVMGAIGPPKPGETSIVAGVGLGVLAHVLALGAGVALGSVACRAVTRTVRNGVVVLVTGSVLVVVLGLRGSIAPWSVPPVMAVSRALAEVPVPSPGAFLLLVGWAVVWCGAVLAGYAAVRRRRS